uniref:Uncharacterized protein n=1 Tax=Panagrellus redivivus TaxID=6233 RepID=A0A7E4VFJ4_PANRE
MRNEQNNDNEESGSREGIAGSRMPSALQSLPPWVIQPGWFCSSQLHRHPVNRAYRPPKCSFGSRTSESSSAATIFKRQPSLLALCASEHASKSTHGFLFSPSY